MVYYEIDENESKHVLSLDDYVRAARGSKFLGALGAGIVVHLCVDCGLR